MKRVWPVLSVLLLLAACTQTSKQESTAENSRERVNGAFEALSLFGAARTYPYERIPSQAWSNAWQTARSLPAHHGSRSDSWESLGPHNRAGRMLAIAFNPQNSESMLAGSASGGLWRTYTGGTGKNAWVRVPTGFPVLGVSSITFHPEDSMVIYIGTGEVYNHLAAGTGAAYRNTRGSYGIGALKSEDGGTTWTKILDMAYADESGVWDIQLCESEPTTLFAATTEGVYRTTDAGESWELVLDVVQVTDVLVHPDDPLRVIAGCGNFGSPEHGIHVSEDGGETWNKITDGVPSLFYGKVQMNYHKANPEIVYASIGNGFGFEDGASWLCKSEDFGQTWSTVNTTDYSKWQGWFAHDVAVHPMNPNRLAVIGIDVWTSDNGGNTLSQKSVGGIGFDNPPIEGPDGWETFVHSDCHDVVWHPDLSNTFYVASDGGIHRSDDGGENYYSCNGRLQTTQFYNGISVSAEDNLFVLGGMQDNGTSRLNDEIDAETGQYLTWSLRFGGDGSWTAIHPSLDLIHYVSYQFLNVQFFAGVDYDPLYIPTIEPTGFIAPFVLSPLDGERMYGASAGVARSNNGGATWTMTNGGAPLDGHPVLSMDISPTNQDVVYAATAPDAGGSGGVYVTIDGGEDWDDVTSTLPARYPMDIHVDSKDPATAYITFSGFGTGHVFRTTNYGATWEDISAGLPDVPTNAVITDPDIPGTIYVGNDIGLFVSTDTGATWAAWSDGLPEAIMVFDLKIHASSRKLYLASHGNGAFWASLPEVEGSPAAIEEQDQELKVYPTLTTGPVWVDLSIDLAGSVLMVYHTSGTFVGQHRLNGHGLQAVDLSGLPAGTYLLRCTNNEQLYTAKVVRL